MKENAWTKKVNQYVSKFTNFANSFDESVNVNANNVETVSAVNNIENNINQNNSIM